MCLHMDLEERKKKNMETWRKKDKFMRVGLSMLKSRKIISVNTFLIYSLILKPSRLCTHHSLFDRRRFALIAGNKHKGQEAVHVRLTHTHTNKHTKIEKEKSSYLSACLHHLDFKFCVEPFTLPLLLLWSM